MPLTHVRTFRVRHYECDALGYLHPATYLRYMQEAAFDASAAAGYDMARYVAIGRQWLIHETEIEVLRPLRYGESVAVKTWVADFRRVRSRRAYELLLAGTGEEVARASTDWAFLDLASGRPVAIPSDMVEAFYPEGYADSARRRTRPLSLPSPPLECFHRRWRVEWRDLDQAGHVNNATYLAYLEDVAVQAAAAAGWPPARCQEEGFRVASLRHQIEYRQPAVLGDELELATWVADPDVNQAVRCHAIARVSDGAPVLRAQTVWACLDQRTGAILAIPLLFLHGVCCG